jgi:hypothetical protein
MTIVPTNVSVISGVAIAATLGVLLTLVHRPAAATTTYHADTNTSADITPALANQGTPQVTVNGVNLPANSGTTNVATPTGTATVTVSGDSATVSTSDSNGDSQTTVSPPGNVNISVQSSSSGGGNVNSSSFSETSSHSSVSSSTSSQVDIETH